MRYVHMVMRYKCDKCMNEADMYVEKGLEEDSNRTLKVKSRVPYKPIPFIIKCPQCRDGFMSDHGFIGFPDLLIVPEGLDLFINEPDSKYGKPVFGYKEGDADEAAESCDRADEGVQEV